MERVNLVKILIILSTLLYLVSFFAPWVYHQWASLIPEETYGEGLYWSYRGIIRIHGSWARYIDMSFFDFWDMHRSSYHVGWINVFFFQVLTVTFGCIGIFLEAISKGRREVKIVVAVVALLSSVLSLLYCAFQMRNYTRSFNIVDFHLGFWIAVSACILFFVTLVAEIFTFISKRRSLTETM